MCVKGGEGGGEVVEGMVQFCIVYSPYGDFRLLQKLTEFYVEPFRRGNRLQFRVFLD